MANINKKEKVRMNLQVSAEINDLLEKIADETGSNRSEVIRRALALMKVAHDARQRGKRLGLVSDPDKLETEIVGVSIGTSSGCEGLTWLPSIWT